MKEEKIERIEELRMRKKVPIEGLTIQNKKGEEVPWEPSGNEPPPDKELENKLLSESVNDCLNALNERQRSVLILRFLDELTLEAVGKLLGISKDTVQRIEKKALADMKQDLEFKGWTKKDLEACKIGDLEIFFRKENNRNG
jgi:RNA polymerase sigma factor (sigma-70 family)